MNLKKRPPLGLLILYSYFTYLCCLPLLADFVHPGIAHSKESITFVRQKIESGEQPWSEAWEKLKNSPSASLEWKPQPRADVERGRSNRPDIGSSEFRNDAMAAYAHALCWTLTDDKAHAQKATEILDAWSHKLRSIGNHDARLLIGMSGYHFSIAAELIKHTWDGWADKNQAQFNSMLRNIWYPVIKDFYPSANGNWDASMLQTMMAMGIFLEDKAMYLKAKNYFLKGKGNGAIGNYFIRSGQCQESGRDQGHTQMGLEFLANTCETAWIQGVDLYSALDSRLLKGFEYTAKYNLKHSVPYQPYKSFEGRYHYKKISEKGRGKFRSMYERVYNHYHNRKGLDAPYTKQAALKYRSNRPDRFSSHLGTLMFSNHPASFKKSETRKTKVVCFGDSITKRGYDKLLAEALGIETIMAGVAGNSTAQALRRMQKDVLSHHPDIVVIFFGTNDLRLDAPKVYVSPKNYKENLETIIKNSQEAGAQVVICTLPPIDIDKYFIRHKKEQYEQSGGLLKLIQTYRDVAIHVAKKHQIPLVDLNTALKAEPKWMSPDGVHPSNEGTRIIARLISEKVKALIKE